jgi:hypothetical protein
MDDVEVVKFLFHSLLGCTSNPFQGSAYLYKNAMQPHTHAHNF